MSEKKLIRIAKEEIAAWHDLPPGLVLAILWSFVYRITRGRSVEEDFFNRSKSHEDSLTCSNL